MPRGQRRTPVSAAEKATTSQQGGGTPATPGPPQDPPSATPGPSDASAEILAAVAALGLRMGQLEQQQQQQQQQGDPVSIDLGLDDDAEEDDDVEYVTNEQAYLSQLVREGIAYANGQPFARHDASRAGYTLPLPQQLHPQPPELGYDLFGDRTWQHIQQEKELKGASLKHEYRAVRCALPYLQDGLMLLEDARSVIEDDDISEIIGAALNTIRGGFALLGKRCDMLKLQVEAKVNPTVITKDALVRLRTHQTPMAEGLDLQDSSILEVLEDLQKTTDTKLARLTAEKIQVLSLTEARRERARGRIPRCKTRRRLRSAGAATSRQCQ
ncbi:hypothetical protein NFJ02_42g109620 [Pycnococcus provasolii]